MPSKDWAKRFYAINQNFPDAANQESNKERWNKILELNPSLGEFSRTLPTEQEIANNRDNIIQSEFKKPYQAESYEEMEYSAAGEGMRPAGLPEPEFSVEVEYGRGCAGQINTFHFIFSHYCTLLELVLPDPNPGIIIEQANAGSFEYCNIYFPEPFYEEKFQFQATMIDPATGKTAKIKTDILKSPAADSRACPSLYGEFVVVIGGNNKCIVWDYRREEIAVDVPDGSGGTVTFPCDDSDLDYFRSLMEGETVKNLLGTEIFKACYPINVLPAEFSPPSLPIPVINPGGFSWTMTNDYYVHYENIAGSSFCSDGNPWYGSEKSYDYDFVSCTAEIGDQITTVATFPWSPMGFSADVAWGVESIEDYLHRHINITEEQYFIRAMSNASPGCTNIGCCYTHAKKSRITTGDIGNVNWFGAIGDDADGKCICDGGWAVSALLSDENTLRLKQGKGPLSDCFAFIAVFVIVQTLFDKVTASGNQIQPPNTATESTDYYVKDCASPRDDVCVGTQNSSKTFCEVFISTDGTDDGSLSYLDSGTVKTTLDLNNLTRNAAIEALVDSVIAANPPVYGANNLSMSYFQWRGSYGG